MRVEVKEVYLVPKMQENILLRTINFAKEVMFWYMINRKLIFMIPPPQTSIIT